MTESHKEKSDIFGEYTTDEVIEAATKVFGPAGIENLLEQLRWQKLHSAQQSPESNRED